MGIDEGELFDKLFCGGAHSFPVLVRFSRGGEEVITFTDNNEDIDFEGESYKAALFEYTPADYMGKGAQLRISAVGNTLANFVDKADDTFRLDVVAAITERGEVTPLRRYSHFMGKVSWGQDMSMNFELGQDDRLDMTFPPYKFDTDTNRGNV